MMRMMIVVVLVIVVVIIIIIIIIINSLRCFTVCKKLCNSIGSASDCVLI